MYLSQETDTQADNECLVIIFIPKTSRRRGWSSELLFVSVQS